MSIPISSLVGGERRTKLDHPRDVPVTQVAFDDNVPDLAFVWQVAIPFDLHASNILNALPYLPLSF